MPLRVRSPGTLSLLVDGGRQRTRGLGVPVGGAADRTAFALANALVGNPDRALALECTLAGPALEADVAVAGAIVGAPFDLFINDHPYPLAKTFNLRPGDVLTLGATRSGLRAYLAVPGGFDAPLCLGSRSAFEPLRKGDELTSAPGHLPGRFFTPEPMNDPGLFRVLRGSHLGLFAGQDFTRTEYVVAEESNRMGLRLRGEPLTRTPGELLSAPVCPGVIQVTNDGQLVVLGVDAQTIGGYPRLAHVIDADLDKLGQLRPGEKIRFAWIELAEALQCNAERQRWLKEWTTRLRLGIHDHPSPQR